MFDRDALELIQQTAVQAAQVQMALNEKVIVVHQDAELKSAEPYAPGRFRFRGTYRTNTLAELIGYVLQRGDVSRAPIVFVNANGGEAKAFFNLGAPDEPGHADDVALLDLKRAAGYDALMSHAGKALKQRELAEFLEDWFDHVVPVYAGLEGETPPRANLTAAIAAIRDITITKAAETNSVEKEMVKSSSAFGQVEAKSRNILPAGFTFTVAPYDGFELRTFNLRLSVLAEEGSAPRLALRIVAFTDVQEQIASEFEDKLRAGLPDVPVYRGTFTP